MAWVANVLSSRRSRSSSSSLAARTVSSSRLGELTGEPLVELTQSGDPGFFRVGLPARRLGGRPPLFELVPEVGPGPDSSFSTARKEAGSASATVQRYARAEHWHQVSPGRHRRGSRLDVHYPYLSRHIASTRGGISLTALHSELAERVRQGSYSTLRDRARRCLHQPRRTPHKPAALPTARLATGWLTRRPSSLSEDEHR